MVKIFFLSLLTIMHISNTASQNNSDAIIGQWMTTDNKIEVEIYKTGDEYKGRIIWLDDSNDKSRPMNTRTDKNNPNPALRTRKLIGLVVMTGLTYNAEQNDWQGGQIYDPESGKQFSAKAYLTGNAYLKIRGFVGLEFLGKDLSFKKIL